MSKIYDQQTQFLQGHGDTGEATPESIQPVVGGESLWEDPLNRAPENLRRRTETLRNAVDDLRYYADYDRSLLLSAAPGTQFICVEPLGDLGSFVLGMTGGPLWAYPALTPGHVSGGRPGGARMFTQVGSDWKPYAGNLGTTDLSFTASSLDTGMRGYADADDFAVDTSGVSLGSNRLTISLVPVPTRDGGVANVTATVTGTPRTKITISYGTRTPTTIRDIINFVRDDINSQTSYGLAHILRASTTSVGTSAPPAITDAVFQGGYDAEAHQIALPDLTAFFDAVSGTTFINRLREGEGLALSFEPGPVQRSTGTTPRGGRRQALFDAPTDRSTGRVSPDNTHPSSAGWSLFNTGREPEKIPGSVPIGKLLEGRFVFIDGTHVGPEHISLGESDTTLERLHRTGPISGASLIGYGGSANWVIPAGTVEDALDSVDSILWSEVPTNSGASKVGYGGSPNGWIPQGKIEAALDKIDVNLALQTVTTGASRVGYGGSPDSWIIQGTVEEALDSVDTGLAATNGATHVGYAGSDAWHADTTVAPLELPTSTVEAALDNVVLQLKDAAPTVSGGLKIGTSAVTGTGATPGNTNFNLSSSSIAGQFRQLLDNTNGLNSRVIESGHRLTTGAPLRKEFSRAVYSDMPLSGAVMLQAELNAPVNLADPTDGKHEYVSLNLQPIVFDYGGYDILPPTNEVSLASATALNLSGWDANQADAVFGHLPIVSNSGYVSPLVFVKITGLVGCDYATDGLYTVVDRTGSVGMVLRRLNGAAPVFTGMTGTASATFMSAIALGNDSAYSRIHALVPPKLPSSEDAWAMVGADSLDAKLVRLYLPNVTNTGLLTGTLYPNRWVFWSTPRGDATGTPFDRDTTNILKYEDKSVLDGNETGTPVDASSSHHHGALYSQRVNYYGTSNTDFTGLSNGTFVPVEVGPTLPNRGARAVTVSFYVEITVTGSPSTAMTSYLTLSFEDNLTNVGHTALITIGLPGAGTWREAQNVQITAPAYESGGHIKVGVRQVVASRTPANGSYSVTTTLVTAVSGVYVGPV